MRWKACRIELSLVIIVANNHLLVECLKCLSGYEGGETKVTEHDDFSKLWMCAYETMVPCDFTQRPKSPNFRGAELKAKVTSCFGQRGRAICYCSSDLCNQNYTVFLQKWIQSPVRNQTLFRCVKEHIEKRARDQIPPQSSTSKSQPATSSPKTQPSPLSKLSPSPTYSRPPQPSKSSLSNTTLEKKIKNATLSVIPTSATRKKVTTRRPAQTTGTPEKSTTNDKSGDGENTDQAPDLNRENSGYSQRPIDYEPHDRTQSDILMFVIIAVGTAILVCLIVPAVIYVVKNRKVQKKDLMRKRKGKKPTKQGSSPANARKSGSVGKQ
ncbi:hypothetical protein RB195_015912 [Necator americanus]|uniref:Activin types I and II receptor domain protein n=1 Tax=Necator americanus TaxID=51031 RepID=A0ABR1E760_NECAM